MANQFQWAKAPKKAAVGGDPQEDIPTSRKLPPYIYQDKGDSPYGYGDPLGKNIDALVGQNVGNDESALRRMIGSIPEGRVKAREIPITAPNRGIPASRSEEH